MRKKLYTRQKHKKSLIYKLYTTRKHTKSAHIQFVYEVETLWRTRIQYVYGKKTLKVGSYTICIRLENALASSYTNCIRQENTSSRLVHSFSECCSRHFFQKSNTISIFSQVFLLSLKRVLSASFCRTRRFCKELSAKEFSFLFRFRKYRLDVNRLPLRVFPERFCVFCEAQEEFWQPLRSYCQYKKIKTEIL